VNKELLFMEQRLIRDYLGDVTPIVFGLTALSAMVLQYILFK
jgi:hypothetical protein